MKALDNILQAQISFQVLQRAGLVKLIEDFDILDIVSTFSRND